MNIGGLRQYVTFQRATETQNDLGEPVQSWADLATTHARVEPLAGKERFSAMMVKSDVDYRILCRYQSALSTLTAKDRITWGSVVMDIKSVINTEGRNVELQVFAKVHI